LLLVQIESANVFKTKAIFDW